MRASVFVSTALLAALGTGCLGGRELAAPDDRVEPGHGPASRADLGLGAPSDDEETPRDVASTSAALSATSGTTFDFTYYVIALRPPNDPNEVTIRDCQGRFLTNASRAFRDDAIMQGTARYRDATGESRTINAGQGCWVSITNWEERWGLGVWDARAGNSYRLRPFRSIAVDPAVLQLGRWYYVKELDGVRMPWPASTMVHDGCVRAVDIGPGIRGRHIDFFAAYRSSYLKLIGGTSSIGGKEKVTLLDGASRCAHHGDGR
jgi:3D (Asp-Asp-Asp) domain-containing protein